MEVDAFSIDQSNNFRFSYEQYSGYLGLAPYSFQPSENGTNFLYQLKNSGLLTHNVVSFYFQKAAGSLIKFGSYDKAGLKDPSKFYVFKTETPDNWAISFAGLKIKANSGSREMTI